MLKWHEIKTPIENGARFMSWHSEVSLHLNVSRKASTETWKKNHALKSFRCNLTISLGHIAQRHSINCVFGLSGFEGFLVFHAESNILWGLRVDDEAQIEIKFIERWKTSKLEQQINSWKIGRTSCLLTVN
jgi:hypothetical protein